MTEEKYPPVVIYDAEAVSGLIKRDLAEARAEDTASKSVVLSLFLPGAGQVLSGRALKGLFFFFIYFASGLIFFSSAGASFLKWARFGGAGADFVPATLAGLAVFTVWLLNMADIILHNRKVPGAGLYLIITAEIAAALAAGLIIIAAL